MNYDRYQLSGRERVQCLLVSLALGTALAWLFYGSVYGMFLFVPAGVLYTETFRRERIQRRKEQLLAEFADAMRAISAALLAGYSMENAWKEAQKEVTKLRGEDACMVRELRQMNAAVGVNVPIEQVLTEFAERSGCEEIESFAEIFAFAKRSGGDFPKIIRTTVQKLTDSMEVRQDIATLLAGKKLEGRIMQGMPLFILAYLNITSGDFLKPLYGNLPGVLIMSGALIGYFAAFKLSGHILDIQV